MGSVSSLQQFKKHLTKLPLLFTLNEGELLYIYLVVSEHTVISVLLREVDGEQRLAKYLRIAKRGTCRWKNW